MTLSTFSQHKINQGTPPWWQENQNVLIKTIIIRSKNEDQRIDIYYESSSIIDKVEPGTQVKDSKLDLSVPPKFNVIFRLFLDHDIKWRWSNSLDAVVTKNAVLDQYYGDLKYCTQKHNESSYNFDDRTNFSSNANLHGIEFKARCSGNIDPLFHGICLNIDLRQPDIKIGTAFAENWLPVSIDPDIKNPPPDETLFVFVDGEVSADTKGSFSPAI